MKYAVIGAGGIGSHLIEQLVNMMSPADTLVVFDGDVFEDRNLNRQRFDRDLVGVNKADAMRIMYELYADVEASDEMILSPEQLEDFEFIFCVPDNNACRRVCLEASDKYKIPLIIAGNEAFSANAIYHDPCMSPSDSYSHPLVVHPEYLKDTPVGNSCGNTNAPPQTIVANCMAASMCLALYIANDDHGLNPDFYKKFIPVEYEFGRTFIKKYTIDDMRREAE